jgi:hypothetical protein
VASSSVEFDVESLIGAINAVQATQIKYAGTQAMKRLGYELRTQLSQYMGKTFNNPVPFTLSSPRYRADGLETEILISREGAKGQDPARYLYPVSTEDGAANKPAYVTRFTKALRAKGIVNESYYAVPWKDGRAVPLNSYDNVPAAFYQSVLAGLARYGVAGAKGTKQAGYQFFSVPDRRIGPSIRRTASLKQGIYRVKGSQLDFLFGYARRPPIVPAKFDFAGFTTRRAEEILPTLLSQELAKAMR